jgi:quinol monooxygenase YgiN
MENIRCCFFDVFHDPTSPGTFRFVECWTGDEKWFWEVQFKRPYYEPYLAITEPMWIVPREMMFAERVQGWSFADERYLLGRVNA